MIQTYVITFSDTSGRRQERTYTTNGWQSVLQALADYYYTWSPLLGRLDAIEVREKRG